MNALKVLLLSPSARGDISGCHCSPDEGPTGQVHRLDEIVRAAGYLHKPRRQCLDRLVMAAVDAKFRFLQQGSQGRAPGRMHTVWAARS